MNKWSKKSAFIALSLILLIGFTGCEDANKEEVANESKSSASQNNKEADEKPKYSDLRIVNDLSQFDLPLKLFTLGHNDISIDGFEVELNENAVNEFERDEWREKLEKEAKNSQEAALKNAKKSDKDLRVRLVNLDIPVTYSKQDSNQAIVEVTDLAPVLKIGKSELVLLSDYVKQKFNNEYISNYILPSKNKTHLNFRVAYKTTSILGEESKYLKFEVSSSPDVLNAIGKNNKGVDTITELTLIPRKPTAFVEYKPFMKYKEYTISTQFVVTSFKLKSSEKRFVIVSGEYDFTGIIFNVEEDDAVIPYPNDYLPAPSFI